ncbi:MAG TPA: NAD(P)H-hydrate epimerase [Isosphaeraceae bacterium]|jgi:NAD(P)H-hydrate epimerase|nr:NAD(P)H-hydrate epimerase [Isosphaeraceae bacterium]
MTIQPRSRDELRAIDRWAAETLGLPTLVLMENAGRGAADWLREQLGPADRVLVVCGVGNNGGDGGVVARRMALEGVAVRVAWAGAADRFSDDAATQHSILKKLGHDQRMIAGAADVADWLTEATWVVDGLLGTGLTREVKDPLRSLIESLNASGKPILSLDLPSGLDADTGRPLGVAVRARLTATFVAPKLGFSAPGAADFTGTVRVFDIGVPFPEKC